MQRTIVTIAILILLALGAWLLLQPERTNTPNDAAPPNGDQNGQQENWQTFESGQTGTGWRFSMSHPPEVTARAVRDTIYEFKFIGPESEPNTEITDGYYISLQLLPDETLARYSEIDEAVGVVTSTTFNGYEARRYQTESELGFLTDHISFMLENGNSALVDISYTTHADTDSSYQEEVEAMLATLAFESSGTASLADRIRVHAPSDNDVVRSPLTVEGEARGMWFFEGSFPVVLVDWDGLIIAEGNAEADGEWMTEEFVPFAAELTFDDPYEEGDPDFMQNGTLILQRANPSGLPENDAALEVPVRFAQ